jgi:hypothetical protein
MFNLFGRKTLEEFKKEAEDTYAVPDVAPVRAPRKHKEYYRVGRTDDGYTTLTMLGDDGYGTMTLTMNQEACEQMIRMLEATFSDTAKSNDHD